MRVLPYLIIASAIACIYGAPNEQAKEIKLVNNNPPKESISSNESSDSSESSSESLNDTESDESLSNISTEKAAKSAAKKDLLKSSSGSSSSSINSRDKKTTSSNESNDFKSGSSVSRRNSNESKEDEHSREADKSSKSSEDSSSHERRQSSTSKSWNDNNSSSEESKESSESDEFKNFSKDFDSESTTVLRSRNSNHNSNDNSSNSKSSDSNSAEDLEESSKSSESEESNSSENSTSKSNTTSSSNDSESKSRLNSQSTGLGANSKSDSRSKSRGSTSSVIKNLNQSRESIESSESDESDEMSKESKKFLESWKTRNKGNRNRKINKLSNAAEESSGNSVKLWNQNRNDKSRESKETSEEFDKNQELSKQQGELWNNKSLNHVGQLSNQSSDNSVKTPDIGNLGKRIIELNSWKNSAKLSLMQLIININGYALKLQNINQDSENWFHKGCEERQYIIENAIANLDKDVSDSTTNWRNAIVKCTVDLREAAFQLQANIKKLGRDAPSSASHQPSDVSRSIRTLHNRVALTVQKLIIQLWSVFRENEKHNVSISGSQDVLSVQSSSVTDINADRNSSNSDTQNNEQVSSNSYTQNDTLISSDSDIQNDAQSLSNSYTENNAKVSLNSYAQNSTQVPSNSYTQNDAHASLNSDTQNYAQALSNSYGVQTSSHSVAQALLNSERENKRESNIHGGPHASSDSASNSQTGSDAASKQLNSGTKSYAESDANRSSNTYVQLSSGSKLKYSLQNGSRATSGSASNSESRSVVKATTPNELGAPSTFTVPLTSKLESHIQSAAQKPQGFVVQSSSPLGTQSSVHSSSHTSSNSAANSQTISEAMPIIYDDAHASSLSNAQSGSATDSLSGFVAKPNIHDNSPAFSPSSEPSISELKSYTQNSAQKSLNFVTQPPSPLGQQSSVHSGLRPSPDSATNLQVGSETIADIRNNWHTLTSTAVQSESEKNLYTQGDAPLLTDSATNLHNSAVIESRIRNSLQTSPSSSVSSASELESYLQSAAQTPPHSVPQPSLPLGTQYSIYNGSLVSTDYATNSQSGSAAKSNAYKGPQAQSTSSVPSVSELEFYSPSSAQVPSHPVVQWPSSVGPESNIYRGLRTSATNSQLDSETTTSTHDSWQESSASDTLLGLESNSNTDGVKLSVLVTNLQSNSAPASSIPNVSTALPTSPVSLIPEFKSSTQNGMLVPQVSTVLSSSGSETLSGIYTATKARSVVPAQSQWITNPHKTSDVPVSIISNIHSGSQSSLSATVQSDTQPDPNTQSGSLSVSSFASQSESGAIPRSNWQSGSGALLGSSPQTESYAVTNPGWPTNLALSFVTSSQLKPHSTPISQPKSDSIAISIWPTDIGFSSSTSPQLSINPNSVPDQQDVSSSSTNSFPQMQSDSIKNSGWQTNLSLGAASAIPDKIPSQFGSELSVISSSPPLLDFSTNPDWYIPYGSTVDSSPHVDSNVPNILSRKTNSDLLPTSDAQTNTNAFPDSGRRTVPDTLAISTSQAETIASSSAARQADNAFFPPSTAVVSPLESSSIKTSGWASTPQNQGQIASDPSSIGHSPATADSWIPLTTPQVTSIVRVTAHRKGSGSSSPASTTRSNGEKSTDVLPSASDGISYSSNNGDSPLPPGKHLIAKVLT